MEAFHIIDQHFVKYAELVHLFWGFFFCLELNEKISMSVVLVGLL